MARVYATGAIFAWRAALVFAVSLLSVPAHAGSAVPLDLEWQAPENECPSRASLLEQVGALVERYPTSATRVRAVARVERTSAGRFVVELVTEQEGAQGTRRIDERSCRALADVIVLILAWMIQPELARSPKLPESRPQPAQARRPDEPPKPAGRSRSEWTLALRAAGDSGSLPRPALGALVSVGYARERFALFAAFSYFPAVRAELPPAAGFRKTGGDFVLLAPALSACLQPTAARLSLCAGSELSYQRGRGFGVSAPASGAKAWLSFGFGLRSALRLGSGYWLEVTGDAMFPTLRETFVLQGLGAVHEPEPVSGRASLGVARSF
jgi:hypothetical protein